MSEIAREKQAAREQAEMDRWSPYWTADRGEIHEAVANPAAVEELQQVVRRLTERVSSLEGKYEAAFRWAGRMQERTDALKAIASLDGDSMSDAGDAVDIARDALEDR